MKKNLFGRHCPVRHSGSKLEIRASSDISFVLRYVDSDCAYLSVCLVDSDLRYFWSLFGFRLYFCLACGRFIGFDNSHYESICWLCEDELEDDSYYMKKRLEYVYATVLSQES
jgi:hypothetical protein